MCEQHDAAGAVGKGVNSAICRAEHGAKLAPGGLVSGPGAGAKGTAAHGRAAEDVDDGEAGAVSEEEGGRGGGARDEQTVRGVQADDVGEAVAGLVGAEACGLGRAEAEVCVAVDVGVGEGVGAFAVVGGDAGGVSTR